MLMVDYYCRRSRTAFRENCVNIMLHTKPAASYSKKWRVFVAQRTPLSREIGRFEHHPPPIRR
ncbi:hypothetical protein IAG25_28825 [Caballeronia sp. EK]|uniref:hypothetical protein n=1 Tax=Caballeronia sp. EK TaxID=2767469 RepID=UPI00165664DB|nr:hypothetical protein [Caballeronia sp. EK]MBC8640824.1 hypothetical protein [Caballeronia sp. EK]